MSAPAILARSWTVIEALSGNSFEGLRNVQVARAVGQSTDLTLRDLQALESLGLTERLPGKEECWRLSPRLVQVALAHQHEIARLNQRVDDFTNRFSRLPS
jgi:DNA-binding IclR family transcriptional regulator